MSNRSIKHRRAETKKLIFRIGAIILAALMVGGTVYSAFAILFMDAYAAGPIYDYGFDMQTSAIPYVSVGIVYAKDVPTSYPIKSETGFVLGSVHSNKEDRAFTPFFTLPQTTLTPAIDANLTKGADGRYTPTNAYTQPTVGGYHIQLSANVTFDQMLSLSYQINTAVTAAGMYAFPAYINGVLFLRVGAFGTYNQAVTSLAMVQHLLTGFAIEIVEPSLTTVSLIDPATDRIVYEYDCGEDYYLGMTPIQTGMNKLSLMVTPAGNPYEGVFACSRYRTDSVNGVQVFNLLNLESYVEGILPYEINSAWPTESLRAQAIACRSYALANWGNHDKAYGFDLCSDHCMAYRGTKGVTEEIVAAVRSTVGEVLSYDGKSFNCAFYSSSNGGESISPNTAWGGTDPINDIGASKTPWERYTDKSHANALWVKEYTPAQLTERLRTYGYTVNGNVTSIQIMEYAGVASSYVTQIALTDTAGNTITLKTTGRIQNVLGLNSANFVLGRGALQYMIEEVQDIKVTERTVGEYTPTVSGTYDPRDYFTSDTYALAGATVLTGAGETVAAQTVNVMTASGVATVGAEAHLLTGVPDLDSGKSQTVINPLDPATGTYTAVTTHKSTEIVTTIKPVVKTYTAAASDNFIFAGKGWGHGVGLSQWGMYDLAKAGAKAETILELYYPGSKIVDRTEIGW